MANWWENDAVVATPAQKGGGNFWEQDELASSPVQAAPQAAPMPQEPTGPAPIAQIPGGVRMSRGGRILTQQEAKERAEMADASLRGAAQGVTFGGGDELVGAAMGAGNWLMGNGYLEHYERARDENRAANDAAQEAHPWAFNIGKIAGGLATMAVGGAPALAAKGTNALTRTGLGFTEGLGWGAFQGFNEGEGTIADKLWSGAKGAAIGAAGGAALPALASGAGAAYRGILSSGAVPEALQGFRSAAVNKVARSFGDDAAAGFNYADDTARMVPENMVLDLRGPNVRAQADALASRTDDASATMQRAVNERAAGAADRIRTVQDEALGTTVGRTAERQALLAERQADISPLYETAAQHAAPLDASPTIAMIDDALKTAAGKKRDALLNIRSQLFDGDAVKSSAAALHELRSEIGRGMRNEWSDVSGALKPIQKTLDDQLDTVPGYAQARARYAESKAIEEAQDAGSQVWAKNTRRDEMADELAGMSEAEARAYRLAARDAAAESMDNAGRTLSQVANDQEAIRGATSLVRSKAGEDKLRMLAETPEAAEAAIQRLQAEEGMALRNSEVNRAAEAGARAHAAKEFPGQSEVGFSRNLAPATPTGLALTAGDWILRKLSMGAVDKFRAANAADAAKIMTAAGETRDQIVKALVERGMTVKAADEQASEAVKTVTKALMNGRAGSIVANDNVNAVAAALSSRQGKAETDTAEAGPMVFSVKPRRAAR